MLKICLIFIIATCSCYAKSWGTSKNVTKTEKLNISSTKTSQGEACAKAYGEAGRKMQSECEKLKGKVNYDDIKISDCITKKLAADKFEGSYQIEYNCLLDEK